MARMAPWEAWFVNSYLNVILHRVSGLERLLRLSLNNTPRRILELGCGAGITSELLTKRFPAATIVAVDIDERQIIRALKRLGIGNVKFVVGDGALLSFPEANFDTCVASYAFHHILEFQDALAEVYRVLRPGGSLYILEVPISWEILRLKGQSNSASRSGELSAYVFTKRTLLRAIAQAGFRLTFARGIAHVYLRCERS